MVYDNYVLLILDYMSFPKEYPAANLEAYTKDGKKIWVASNIGLGRTDAYVNFCGHGVAANTIIVGNFAGFQCLINVLDGKLLKTYFTK
jgi:hypothetical protein